VLVEETYADIDTTTFYGLSPVQLAAERGLEDVVVYLINMGADRTDLDVPEMSDCEDDIEDMEVCITFAGFRPIARIWSWGDGEQNTFWKF
jgi:hypothetical protein